MLLFAALVAGSNSFGKLIADDIDPAALTAIRFALAGAILGGGALGHGPVAVRTLPPRHGAICRSARPMPGFSF